MKKVGLETDVLYRVRLYLDPRMELLEEKETMTLLEDDLMKTEKEKRNFIMSYFDEIPEFKQLSSLKPLAKSMCLREGIKGQRQLRVLFEREIILRTDLRFGKAPSEGSKADSLGYFKFNERDINTFIESMTRLIRHFKYDESKIFNLAPEADIQTEIASMISD